MKNKTVTLHIRINPDLLNLLENDYKIKKSRTYKSGLTFSEYIRKILLMYVTR